MPTQTVQKVKSTKTCSNCGGNVAGSAKECQNCGSSDLKKSLVIIRKSEMTGEDAHAPDPQELTSENSGDESEEDDEEFEDLEEDEFEPSEEEDDEDEDSEDDEEEDDEDSEDEEAEEDEEEDEEDRKVTKKIVRRRRVSKAAGADMENVNLDIMLAALTVMDDISKAVTNGSVEGDDSEYERAMVAFNNVMDAGAPAWVSGESISKEDKAAKLKRLKARVAEIRAKLKDSGDDGADDDEDDVEKSDIFKGLTPAAAAILKQAQEIQERDKAREFEEVAKSFGELTTPTPELGAALRVLSETDKTAYETVTKALRAAAEQSKQSDIFKNFGSAAPGIHANGGNGTDDLETIAKSLRAGNSNLTEEQAYAQALHQNPHLYDAIIAGR